MLMSKSTVAFRIETEKQERLDTLATLLDRDRSYMINEAIDTLLETHEWPVKHIQEGQRQAHAGEFVEEQDWRSAFHQNRT